VHLHRLDLSGDTSGGEGDNLTGLEHTGFDTADGDSTNAANLVDVLEGKAKRLVDGALGGVDAVRASRR